MLGGGLKRHIERYDERIEYTMHKFIQKIMAVLSRGEARASIWGVKL